MIDFDSVHDWFPNLSGLLNDHVPAEVIARIQTASLEFFEDARKLLFQLADREAIIDATLAWIRSDTIVGYHGTSEDGPE